MRRSKFRQTLCSELISKSDAFGQIYPYPLRFWVLVWQLQYTLKLEQQLFYVLLRKSAFHYPWSILSVAYMEHGFRLLRTICQWQEYTREKVLDHRMPSRFRKHWPQTLQLCRICIWSWSYYHSAIVFYGKHFASFSTFQSQNLIFWNRLLHQTLTAVDQCMVHCRRSTFRTFSVKVLESFVGGLIWSISTKC